MRIHPPFLHSTMDSTLIPNSIPFTPPSVRNSSDENQPEACIPPWIHPNAPTISELAQSQAQSLHKWPQLGGNGFDERRASDSDAEKQKSDSATSPTTSSMFSPSSDSQFIGHQLSSPPDLPMTRAREYTFIFITCIAQFLSLGALNQTVAPVMVLARHFHIEDYGTLSWFSASFSMSVGTFILPAGMYTELLPSVALFVNVRLQYIKALDTLSLCDLLLTLWAQCFH
jgi:hypothetical protein